jgi:hypothetical protein
MDSKSRSNQHNRQQSTGTNRTLFSPTISYDSSTSTAVATGLDANNPIPIPNHPKPLNEHTPPAAALKVLTNNSTPQSTENEKEHGSAEPTPFAYDSNVVKKHDQYVDLAAGALLTEGEGEKKGKVVANGIGDPEKQLLPPSNHRNHHNHNSNNNNVASSASDESTAVDALTANGDHPSNRGEDDEDDSAEINDGRPLLMGRRLAVLIAYVYHLSIHIPFHCIPPYQDFLFYLPPFPPSYSVVPSCFGGTGARCLFSLLVEIGANHTPSFSFF